MADEEVGGVSFMLGQLKQGMDTILRTLSEDREAAARYRTDIRNEVSGLRGEYHDVRADLTIVKEKVEKIEPKVEKLERSEHREEGEKNLLSVMAQGAQLLIGMIGGLIVLFVDRWFFHR